MKNPNHWWSTIAVQLQYPRPRGTEVVLTNSSIVHPAWTKLQVPATRTTPSPGSLSSQDSPANIKHELFTHEQQSLSLIENRFAINKQRNYKVRSQLSLVVGRQGNRRPRPKPNSEGSRALLWLSWSWTSKGRTQQIMDKESLNLWT